MAEIMCGRVMKRHSPSFMSGQSASGMSLSMGGGMGALGGFTKQAESGASDAAAKTKKALAGSAGMSLPRFTPSWRK